MAELFQRRFSPNSGFKFVWDIIVSIRARKSVLSLGNRDTSNFELLHYLLFKAAIEEGVIGGGCCLLRLSLKINDIKKLIDNEEQKMGAYIFKMALEYPSRQIAKNVGVNGSIVIEKPDGQMPNLVFFKDNKGHMYWILKGCSDKPGILLQREIYM